MSTIRESLPLANQEIERLTTEAELAGEFRKAQSRELMRLRSANAELLAASAVVSLRHTASSATPERLLQAELQRLRSVIDVREQALRALQADNDRQRAISVSLLAALERALARAKGETT